MRKPRLMTPGPAMVPEDVLLELARPVIHHRSDEAKQVITEVIDGLKEVFQTQNDVLILTASGTGAMEAAVVNAVPPGGKALVLSAGYFAARWANICKAFGINAVVLETEWGQPVDPDQVAEALRQHPDTVCVLGTLSETSTGTGHPVEAIGRIVAETPAVFAVDGISGVGAMECRTDEWGIDLLCVGSQKALMLPPGLAFVAVSPKAWAKIDSFDSHSYLLQPQGGSQEDQGIRHALHAGPHPDPGPAHGPAADQGGGDRKRLAAPSQDERGLPGRNPGARARALQRQAGRGPDGVSRPRGPEGGADPQQAVRAVRHLRPSAARTSSRERSSGSATWATPTRST